MLSDPEIAVLIEHAIRARECAYAPYSSYAVGAAVVDEESRVFFGSNVENASYGLSLCAERTAIAAAVAAGARRLKAVVIVTEDDPPSAPCGACRQWLAEFGGDNLQVIVANTARRFKRFTLNDLLPSAFRLERRRP